MPPWPGSTDRGALGRAGGRFGSTLGRQRRSRFTCAGAHCCIVAVLLPSDVASARKGAARTMPRRYCPLFTHSHLDAFFFFFF